MENLVPGDIIQLAAGDIIPGDIRLLHSKNLYISQSALTGESLPVEKGDDASIGSSSSENILDNKNICLIGTNVDIGTATAIVIDTGGKTYFGAMAKLLTDAWLIVNNLPGIQGRGNQSQPDSKKYRSVANDTLQIPGMECLLKLTLHLTKMIDFPDGILL